MPWCTVDGAEIPIPFPTTVWMMVKSCKGWDKQLSINWCRISVLPFRCWEDFGNFFLQRSMKQTKRMILPGDSSRDLFIPDRWVGHQQPFQKVTQSPSQRSRAELPGHCFFSFNVWNQSCFCFSNKALKM